MMINLNTIIDIHLIRSEFIYLFQVTSRTRANRHQLITSKLNFNNAFYFPKKKNRRKNIVRYAISISECIYLSIFSFDMAINFRINEHTLCARMNAFNVILKFQKINCVLLQNKFHTTHCQIRPNTHIANMTRQKYFDGIISSQFERCDDFQYEKNS